MSEPHYSSSEIGNVDASTVVVTFDQDVTLFVAPPIPPVETGHGTGGVVDSQAFVDWLATRPRMGWIKPKRNLEPIVIAESIDTQAETLKENQNRMALLTALMVIDDE